VNYRGQGEGFADISVDRSVDFDLASLPFGSAGLARSLRDLEAIAELARNRDKELVQIVERVKVGDLDEAVRIAREIGLTEDDLRRRGGGLGPFALLVVAVALVLVTAQPTSVTADPPPTPTRPLDLQQETLEDVDRYLGGS
jgi:hypothetical protein